MSKSKTTMAKQVAQAVMDFQEKTTGHMPKAVTVVLSNDTLVFTLHEALSPAERDLAKKPAGAAKVQEFHRQLFSTSAQPLRDEIERITGVKVRESIAEVEPATGAVVCAFASGTMVQVFQLVHGISAKTWDKSVSAKSSGRTKSVKAKSKKTGAK
ncbi:MAG: DUF2294 family protein [Planctomycetaceae bacterium]|nr:MAG: DUF2294 family protein [Planctomycetaceae bacterium]